jgi:glycosyltransferase involved in cell wall biosynthesis/GT2 family glycosyltransferase/tetratricopeptide (TPR) repeat protein
MMSSSEAFHLATPLLLTGEFRPDEGFAFTFVLGAELHAYTDTDDSNRRSPLILLEDGRPLGPAHALHADIRRLGGGRFSFWKNSLWFSSSDSTDPNSNGRRYEIGYIEPEVQVDRPANGLEADGRSAKKLTEEMPLLLTGKFRPDVGFAFAVILAAELHDQTDTNDANRRSPLILLEDGRPLGPAHAVHADIRLLGHGRFSFWNNSLWFSASDNTDPNSNGRRYEIDFDKPKFQIEMPIEDIEADARSLEAFTALWPDDPAGWNRRAEIAAKLGRSQELKQLLRQPAEQLRTSTSDAFAVFAKRMAACRFWKEAIDLARTAIQLNPSMAANHAFLGEMLEAEGHLTDALSAYRCAIALDPEFNSQLSNHVDRLVRIVALVGDTSMPIELPGAVFRALTQYAGKRPLERHAVPGRIVFVIDSLVAGGAERQLVATIRALLQSIPESIESLVILCWSVKGEQGFFLPYLAGLPVEVVEIDREDKTFDTERDSLSSEELECLELLPPVMRKRMWCLMREILARRPWVVHGWKLQIEAALAAMLSRVPRIILSEQSLAPPRVEEAMGGAPSLAYRWSAYEALVGVPQVILTANSQAGASDWARWLRLPEERVLEFRNVIDDTLYGLSEPAPDERKPRLRESLRLPSGTQLVGSAFRMAPEKGPIAWAEVAAIVLRERPQTHFVVLGDGPLFGEFKKRLAELGLIDAFTLPGFVTDVPAFLREMDVVLLTSKIEGIPNVLIEAQLLGVPVVACAVGGVEEAMRDGSTGYCVHDPSPDRLALKVIDALANVEWLSAAGQAGPQFVRGRFSKDCLVSTLRPLYQLGGPVVRRPHSMAIAVLFFDRVEQTIECIESVVTAGVPVWILNNGSNPAGRAELGRFCEPYKHVSIIDSSQNLGVARGRNRLIERIREDWILFLDNDIVVETSDWLNIIEDLISRNADIDAFLPLLVTDGRPGRTPSRFSIEGDLVRRRLVHGTRQLTNVFSGGAAFVSRSVFERLSGYDEEMFVGLEDFEFAVRAIRSGMPLRVISLPEVRLIHEHRSARSTVDADAARVRYDGDRIAASAQTILLRHGVRLEGDSLRWSAEMLRSILEGSGQ